MKKLTSEMTTTDGIMSIDNESLAPVDITMK